MRASPSARTRDPAGPTFGVVDGPALAVARLMGAPPRALTHRLVVFLSIGLLVLAWAAWTSFGDVSRYGGTDLRARVLGARMLLEGLSPYTTPQNELTPERLLDPDRNFVSITRCTYSPAMLVLYAPLAGIDYGAQRYLWAGLEWAALVGSILVLGRAVPGARAKALFAGGALVFFAGDWSMRLHVERGQHYVFVLLALSLATLVAVRMRKGTMRRADSFASGLLLGAAAAMRPSMIAAAGPLLLLRRWRTVLGIIAGAGVCVAAVLPLAGPKLWREFFDGAKFHETIAYKGLEGLDPPAEFYQRVLPREASRPDWRYIVDGADFTEMMPQRVMSLTFVTLYQLYPDVFQKFVPRNYMSLVAKVLALGACAIAGAACLFSRGRVGITTALACGFAMITVGEYFLPIRFSYADVLCLPTLAMMSPFLIRRRGRGWLVALVAVMLPGLVVPAVMPMPTDPTVLPTLSAPDTLAQAVRSLGLLVVPSAFLLGLLVNRGLRAHLRARAGRSITEPGGG